ncbi:MAG: bacteriohemerythrin [Pseudodesulfovibrio sp.]|uniref:bacteriohemerythrin n=1 Tax=Pseudodesulfovibrio sp. TaxID=2035812 RepID=UPI003D124DB8
MAQIEWCDSHSVGIPALDDQHKALVALTNQLFLAIMRDEGQKELGRVLAELARYADYHFDFEEQILTEHGFPESGFSHHREEHRKLKSRVQTLLIQHEEGSVALDLDVYSFLREWMTEHMIGTDSEYAAFLASKAVR